MHRPWCVTFSFIFLLTKWHLSEVSGTVNLSLGTVSVLVEQFEPVSFSNLNELIQFMRPTKCHLDFLPVNLMKEVFTTVGSVLVTFMKSCLSLGTVPKHAIVEPLLKIPFIFSYFRPICHLHFLSKIFIKNVFIQLQSFLESKGIFEKFQLSFRWRR